MNFDYNDKSFANYMKQHYPRLCKDYLSMDGFEMLRDSRVAYSRAEYWYIEWDGSEKSMFDILNLYLFTYQYPPQGKIIDGVLYIGVFVKCWCDKKIQELYEGFCKGTCFVFNIQETRDEVKTYYKKDFERLFEKKLDKIHKK